MASSKVKVPLSWVRVTLYLPVAAVFDAESFTLMVGLGFFLVTFPTLAETTATPGSDTVHTLGESALKSNPVPRDDGGQRLALLDRGLRELA